MITLTDGPLELFHELQETAEFEKSLDEYLGVLDNWPVPALLPPASWTSRAATWWRLLEVAALEKTASTRPASSALSWAWTTRPCSEKSSPPPGRCSALFAIQSISAQKFTGELALHFFFLNVGRLGHPWLVRVEIPAWVACNPDALRNLHAVLVAQSEIMGAAQPYPYLLHRAHEVAVVTLDDQEQLERMIDIEMRNQGVEMGEVSHKQGNKDQSSSSTKKRYGK